jgi:hypothetical protein
VTLTGGCNHPAQTKVAVTKSTIQTSRQTRRVGDIMFLRFRSDVAYAKN